MPRIRDFRGVSHALVRRPRQLQPGRARNRSFSPRSQYDQVDQIRGMDITITTDGDATTAGPGAARSLQLPVPEARGTSLWRRPAWSSARSDARKIVKKYAAKRAELKETIREPQDADAKRGEAAQAEAAGAAARCQPRRASATAARSPGVRAACTASSAWRGTKIREAAMPRRYPGPVARPSW